MIAFNHSMYSAETVKKNFPFQTRSGIQKHLLFFTNWIPAFPIIKRDRLSGMEFFKYLCAQTNLPLFCLNFLVRTLRLKKWIY